MHPTAALIVWLFAVLVAQYVSYPALAGLLLMIFASTPQAFTPFLKFARRARWLLLSLWLILAYGKAGEALADLPWAPTLEGMAEANLQAVRLLVLLACLAWLFARLGRDGLLAALWGALRPFGGLGLDVERLVVRLSLVLEHLQKPMPKGAWRSMLMMENRPDVESSSIALQLPRWCWLDSLLPAVAGAVFLWIVWQ